MIAVWGIVIGCLVLIVALLVTGSSSDPVEGRLAEFAGDEIQSTPARDRTSAALVAPPTTASQVNPEAVRRSRARQQQKPTLRDRLIQAGLYRERSSSFFAMLKVGLAIVPIGVGLAAGMTGITPIPYGVAIGGILSLFGFVAPSFFLDYLKADRQKRIRRGLPDALDVIVVCLEGGVSLSGSFSRVASELSDAHPLLALELRIVEREVQMGRSTGEAMRNFSNRFDLEELRSMAAVIIQTERFGTSVSKAFTVYATSLRLKRQQYAEELAHKAVVKIIFPTVLFIFPAIFVVILGPAAIKIYDAFSKSGFGL